MASSSPPPTTTTRATITHRLKTLSSSTYQPIFFSFTYFPTKYTPFPTIHLHRSLMLRPISPKAWSGRCHASSPGPPSPPPPPPESDPEPLSTSSSSGVAETISKIQDSAQIFFAVLFWMSLFFWASAWDGRNGDRPNKGSRFRR